MNNRVYWSVLLAGISLSGCGSGGRYEWSAYEGASPSMPLNQALSVCDSIAEGARTSAENSYTASRQKFTIQPNGYGGANVTPNSSSGGGFWGGVANTLTVQSKGRQAYKPVFKGCMAEKGYEQRKVTKLNNPSSSYKESTPYGNLLKREKPQ